MKGTWVLLVLVGVLAFCPAAGIAAEHGGQDVAEHGGTAMADGAKWTLSLTKDSTPSPWTKEVGYGTRVGQKLVFGVKNLLLGWTDLFTEPKEAMDGGQGFWRGLGYGVKDLIENEVGGVVHIVTFPVTAIDAPLPEGGVQL